MSRGIGMGFLLTQVKDVFRIGRNNQFWQLIDQLLVVSKMPLVKSLRSKKVITVPKKTPKDPGVLPKFLLSYNPKNDIE